MPYFARGYKKKSLVVQEMSLQRKYQLPEKLRTAFYSGQMQKVTTLTAFRALKFESIQTLISVNFVRKRYSKTANVLTKQISRRQNLWMTVTPFKTHTQCKKLTFLEKALSFAVKVKLSTFVFNFIGKIMAMTAHASYV